MNLLSKYAHDFVEPFDHIDAEFELYLECDNKEKVSEDLTDENILLFLMNKALGILNICLGWSILFLSN